MEKSECDENEIGFENKNKDVDYSGKMSRSWLLTINNFTDADVRQIRAENTVYKVWQFEIGKKGTKHLHCVLYFKNARIWPKKRYPTARIEIPRDLNDCINYCKKERTRVDGPWEEGECPCQGRRKDLEQLAESIKNGASLRDIALENPSHFIRYHRGLQAYKETLMKPRDKSKPMKVYWIYGNAGLGKSRYVWDTYDVEDIYPKDNTIWWNGYYQQKVIIWDDFSEKVDFRYFLRVTDRFPEQVQTKGGYVQLNSEHLYITCEFPPEEIFGGTDNIKEQCLRRINVIYRMENDGNMTVIKDNY